MRTFVSSAVVAVAISTLALACANPKNQRPASEPTPQRAFNEPRPQQAYDPITGAPRPQQPFSEPKPQTSALPAPSGQKPIETPEPQKPFYGPGLTAPDQTQAKTERALTDAEVIGVADAANKGEVQMAEVALKKATRPEVKQFASMMKTNHQKALDSDRKLQQKTKITSAESDVSALLTSDTEKTLKELHDKQGKDFDRAYMDSQVKVHKDVLTAIDNRLVPSVQNGEVKTMVTDMRRAVADHLMKAESVQKKMESTSVSSSGDSKAKDHSKARANEPKPVEKR